MSYQQRVRQSTRERSGRYSVINRCEVCNKSVGVDYYSDGRTADSGNGGLVLCRADALKGNVMSNEDAIKFYSKEKKA